MRNSAKILALLLVLALCVTGIVLAVSADEPAAQAITEPTFAGVLPENATITLDETVAAQLTSAGYVALQFADEAEFLAAKEAGYDALAAKGMTTFAHPSTSCYVYLLTDVGGATMTAVNGVTQLFNLGGKTLAYTTAGGNSSGTAEKITYFNGTFNENRTGGHGLHRIQGYSEPKTYSLAFVNATVITNGSRPYAAESVRTFNLYFEDSTLNVNGSMFALIGFNATQTPNVNAIFKDTTINTASVMFSFNSAAGANSTVYLDSECVVNGALYDKGTVSHVTTTVENGCKINSAALASFNNTAATTLVTESGVEFVDTGAHYTLMTPPVIPDDTTFTASADFKTANGKFVVYANEFDFYADLEGGVIDGLVGGNSVIVDDNGDTFPSSGYVCMLASYTLRPDATINVTDKLVINLGGTTFTEKGVGGQRGNALTVSTISVAADADLGIYNGKFIDGVSSAQATNTLAAGASLEVKNVTLQATSIWENWSSTFCFNGAANISFEDCVITQGKQVTIVLLNSAAVYNVDLKNVSYTDNAAHSLVGTTTQSGATVNRIPSNSAYHGFISTPVAATVSVNVDKDCVVNSGFIVNTANSGANVTLNAEVGFKTWSTDYTTAYVKAAADAVTNGYDWQSGEYTAFTIVDTVNFTENGEAATASFVNDGDFYVVWKASSVTWYDENGDVITSVDNLTPDMALTAPKEFANEIIAVEGGYAIRGGAWSDTEGGSAVEIPTVIAPGTAYTFYEVYTEQAATIVVFDSEGGSAVAAYATTQLTKDIVGEFPAGAYVLVYTDLTVDYGEVVDMTFDNYKGNLTIDLGGNTLTQTSYGSGIGMAWATPAAGVTVTIKNGDINVATTATSQNDIATLISGKGAGTLKFHDVDITTLGYVGDLKAGSVVLELCTIKQPNTAANWTSFTLGNTSSATAIDLQLLGTYYSLQTQSGGRLAYLYAGGVEKDISITVSDYEGVYSYLRTGYIFDIRQTTELNANTELSFTLQNCYVSSWNNMIAGAGTFLWDTDGTGNYAANAALDKQNVSFTFDDFLYSRDDLFDYEKRTSHVILKTANLNAYKIVKTWRANNSFIAIPELNIDVNLTLYSDFNLNLYIPTDFVADQITYLGQVIFDKSLADTYDVVDGKYKIVIENIAPNKAAKSIELGFVFNETATFNEDGTMMSRDISRTLTAKYSVIKYAADLIATEDAKSVAAMKALLGYVDAAYDNFDGDESDEATMALLEELITDNGVAAFLAGYAPKASEGDTDFVEGTGVTAAFQIGAVTKLYVTFPAGAEWSIVGDKLTKTGKGGECVIELPAYALTDVLTITVGDATATFSFGEYAEYLMTDGTDNATEDAVLVAMYAYGETARALKAQVDAENA